MMTFPLLSIATHTGPLLVFVAVMLMWTDVQAGEEPVTPAPAKSRASDSIYRPVGNDLATPGIQVPSTDPAPTSADNF